MTPATTREAERLASDAKRSSAQGDHENAVRLQRQAVERFGAEYEAARGQEPGADVQSAAHKLSDHLGRLGGILRRAGRPLEALDSYTAGARLEDEWWLDDSYNRTNKIVLSLLTELETPAEVRDEVRRVAAVVQDQVERTRRNQWWAWADLGVLSLLDGDASTALWAYDQFRGARARPSDYRSTLSVLRELRPVLERTAPDLVAGFAAAEEQLEQRHGVFLSCPNEDAELAATVGRALAARLGDDHVFSGGRRGVPGEGLTDKLRRSLQRSAVQVLFIDADWPAAHGAERPADALHWEVTAARSAGLRIVPVLLDDAAPLATRDLPPDLQFLASLQATRIRRKGTESEVIALVDLIAGPA